MTHTPIGAALYNSSMVSHFCACEVPCSMSNGGRNNNIQYIAGFVPKENRNQFETSACTIETRKKGNSINIFL